MRLIVLLLLMLTSSSLVGQIDSSYMDENHYRGEDGKIYPITPSTQSIFVIAEVLNKVLDLFVESKEEKESDELIFAKAQKILAGVELKKIVITNKIKKQIKKLRKDYSKGKVDKFEYVYLKARYLGLSIEDLGIIDSRIKTLSINY